MVYVIVSIFVWGYLGTFYYIFLLLSFRAPSGNEAKLVSFLQRFAVSLALAFRSRDRLVTLGLCAEKKSSRSFVFFLFINKTKDGDPRVWRNFVS